MPRRKDAHADHVQAVMIPLFGNFTVDESGQLDRDRMQLSMAATVAVNLSGLTTGGLYILLRSTRLGRIGPRGYAEFDSQKSNLGKRPSTPMYTKQMEQLVSPVRLQRIEMTTDRIDEASNEEEKVESRPGTPAGPAPDQLSSKAVQSSPPKAPAAAHIPAVSTRRPSIRKDSYNIFPSKQEAPPDVKSIYLLPAATYDPTTKANAPTESPFDLLLPPPTIRTSRHLRDSSLGSSATVQIGLRVSNINDMPPVTSFYQAPYPRESQFPTSFGLAISTDDPFVGDGTQDIGLQNTGKVLERTAEKQLPPVPLSIAKKDTKGDEDETTLSPSVYSPQAQSRRGANPRGSPTRPPPPGPSWSPEGRHRVQSVEWI